MNYGIYFDESNKLDQPNGDYSYYGALGTTQPIIDEIVKEIQNINGKLNTNSEMHFVDYTRTMAGVLSQQNFYSSIITPHILKGERVFVIISDAMRYEVGMQIGNRRVISKIGM